MIIDVLSWAALIIGSFFIVVGGIGLLRLPDVFCRFHAAGVTDTAGAGFIGLGLMLQAGATLVTVKLMLMLIFLWITSPTSTHALARAALVSGLKPWRKAHDDESNDDDGDA